MWVWKLKNDTVIIGTYGLPWSCCFYSFMNNVWPLSSKKSLEKYHLYSTGVEACGVCVYVQVECIGGRARLVEGHSEISGSGSSSNSSSLSSTDFSHSLPTIQTTLLEGHTAPTSNALWLEGKNLLVTRWVVWMYSWKGKSLLFSPYFLDTLYT